MLFSFVPTSGAGQGVQRSLTAGLFISYSVVTFGSTFEKENTLEGRFWSPVY